MDAPRRLGVGLLAWALVVAGGCGRWGMKGTRDVGGDAAVDAPRGPVDLGEPRRDAGEPRRDAGRPDLIPANLRVVTIAGTGKAGFRDGPALSAAFSEPYSVAVDRAGRVYVADSANHRIRVIEAGRVRTLAGTGKAGYRDGPVASAQFDKPRKVDLDARGRVYIGDTGNKRIRMIEGGRVRTVAGDGLKWSSYTSWPTQRALDIPLDRPEQMAVMADGTIVLGSGGPARIANGFVHRMLRWDTRSIRGPVDVGDDGSIYRATPEGDVVRLWPDGLVTQVGIPFWSDKAAIGGSVQVYEEMTIAVAAADRVYAGWSTVPPRQAGLTDMVMVYAPGRSARYAGSGAEGFADGPALSAKFKNMRGLAVDHRGRVFVADTGNNRIRLIRP